MDGIPLQEVRDHLERIVADDLFAGAARLCRFLRFTVESKLSGDEAHVKEYVLGREVFDRRDDYDPRLDPIVRVEARRLRAKLTEYYAGPGREEAVRLDYPRGSYVPVVTRPSPASAPATVAGRLNWRWLSIGAVIVLGLVGLASYRLWLPRSPQMIAVLPVRWISSAGDLDKVDADIAEAVDAELANRDVARVVAWPVMLRYQTEHQSLGKVASDVGATTILMVSVRDVDRRKLATVFVMDAASGQKRRVESYFRDDLSTFASQRALAHQIVSDLTPLLREAQ